MGSTTHFGIGVLGGFAQRVKGGSAALVEGQSGGIPLGEFGAAEFHNEAVDVTCRAVRTQRIGEGQKARQDQDRCAHARLLRVARNLWMVTHKAERWKSDGE